MRRSVDPVPCLVHDPVVSLEGVKAAPALVLEGSL
jgi:hypothetical protein